MTLMSTPNSSQNYAVIVHGMSAMLALFVHLAAARADVAGARGPQNRVEGRLGGQHAPRDFGAVVDQVDRLEPDLAAPFIRHGVLRPEPGPARCRPG